MSVLGLTIDYGPFGFMDYFNPDHICNASGKVGCVSFCWLYCAETVQKASMMYNVNVQKQL